MPTRILSVSATIAAAFAAAMVFSGCSGRPGAAQKPNPAGWHRPWTDDDVVKPAWISDPTSGGTTMAAYGSTPADPYASTSVLRARAMQSARDELARMVRVRVQSVLKDWMAEDSASYARFSESASRGIADQSVEGSYQRADWTHPKTAEYFVWVVVDPAVARKMAKAVAESAKAAATGDAQLDAHLQAKAGSDAGFAELEGLLDGSGK